MFTLIFNECDITHVRGGYIDYLIYAHPLRKTAYENPIDYLAAYKKAFVVFEINYN